MDKDNYSIWISNYLTLSISNYSSILPTRRTEMPISNISNKPNFDK